MPLNKPYYRISRPFTNGNYLINTILETYHVDLNYSNDRISLVRVYHLLIKDLLNIFDYIEPCNDNLNTYSHRIYELFLRASTEFETNCKAILSANIFSKKKDFNITDYLKINNALKLNEFQIKLNIWHPVPKPIIPFDKWSSVSPLKWYQDYNNVKHDRNINFSKANLENLITSIAAVYVLLYSQFNVLVFSPYQIVEYLCNDNDGFEYIENSIFKIKPPDSWNINEKYDFDWEKLKNTNEPFAKYDFNK